MPRDWEIGTVRAIVRFVALLSLVAGFSSHAQNAANGAIYYQSFPASCADCHGPNPTKDQYRSTASGGVKSGGESS